MIPTLFFYELVLVALAWLCLMRWWLWPHDPATRRAQSNSQIPRHHATKASH